MRYSFDEYVLDIQRHELHHAGAPIKLRRKVFQVLVYLLAHRDRVVPKQELLDHLWPGQFVGEAALTSCIQALRRALGERGRTPRFLRTLHSQGYRFVGAVEVGEHLPADEAPHVLPVRRGEKATRQTEGPSPALSSSLADLGSAPWLTRGGVFRHDTDPGALHPLPSGEGGGEGSSAIPPSIPHPNPLPEGEGTTYGLQGCPPWEALDGEHKQVTVLCGALAEAPTLAARLGPEAMHYLMYDVLMLAQDTVQRYEGTLTQVSSDGFLALFGAPVAQEDHARRAVSAALELRQRLRAPHAIRGQPHGVALRLGLHTGPVVVGPLAYEPQRPYTAAGDTLHLATCLQQRAAPDTLLVSAATYALVQDEVQGEACATLALKGPFPPEPIYRIRALLQRRAGVPRRGARPLSRFVGRTQELALLHERLAQALCGQGQVIGIAGEPGLGKSRLLAEFVHSLRGRPVTYCEGHCLAYGSATPYLPVRDLFRQLWDLPDAAPATAITATIHQRLREAGVASEDEALVLLQLLDVPVDLAPSAALDPLERKARTFALLWHVIRQASRRQPLVLAVENLHWIDPTSEEWLASLVERLGDTPVLLLATYRPGYQPPWIKHSAATQMALSRLSPRDSLIVLQSVLQAAQLPMPVREAIVAKAAGNPFFVEELTWAAVEHGARACTLRLSDTIEAVLAARIDRLPLEEKRLLQTAAVIGTEVPVPLLQRLAGLPEEVLEQGLAHLQGTEFLYETHLFPEHAYTFKHVLTCEVAYSSLLHERRRALHIKIMDALEALYPNHLGEYAERLAHHALQGEVWEKAVLYCREVGEKARNRGAWREALTRFEQALDALGHLREHPDTGVLAIELHHRLGAMLSMLGAHARSLVLLGEAAARARRLDDRARLGGVLSRMVTVHMIVGDVDGALAAGREALELAVTLGDPTLQAHASYRVGQVYAGIGEYSRAAEVLRGNVEALARCMSGDMRIFCIKSQAWLQQVLGVLGEFAEGRRHGEEALRLAMIDGQWQRGTPITARARLGSLYLAQGDLEAAIRVFAEGLALCRATGQEASLAAIAGGLGEAYAHTGRLDEGLALLEEARQDDLRTGRLGGSYVTHLRQLSAVYLLAGRVDEAWQHACQALDLARAQKLCGHEAQALCQLGAVHAQASPPDVPQAETRYREALTLAEALGMRPLQAHCHHGFGTLYAKTDRPEQARAALATAIALYRAMAMTFWLPQAEAALAEAEGRGQSIAAGAGRIST
jgi:class 3 adenylate cyclase/DNA-binding winged helix-turn-helix (wHTH) protein/tetratricopeptide (TPR) repeat protein